jgi:hypothetical protein
MEQATAISKALRIGLHGNVPALPAGTIAAMPMLGSPATE